MVRPEWIVASIEQGKLLPFRDFELETIREEKHQRLDGFLVQPQPKKWLLEKKCEESNPNPNEGEGETICLTNTTTAAEFIKNYFEYSRLHFIGTWKLRIEAFTLQHPNRGPQPSPSSKQIFFCMH